MAKFGSKRDKGTPAISTASLPDIIFILLFFFMVITKMRDAELKVTIRTPEASELTKLEKKSLVNYLYIGRPIEKYQSLYGTRPRIQLGDKFATVGDIPLFLEKHKVSVPEAQHASITSSLRVDGKITMGIVQDVKTQLRKSGQLKVNYSARTKVQAAE
ncbi:MAG: biopolymer transporter ExbD [Saprospirales bacterium]|jgi:biopolymer transport protein ExbD|nr:biopolymer transporter ExbD [Saprospirales bacterium]MBK6905082.1 biopolymer transporter ExbD [Saprospirales bacterium]MBK7335257.1 biopolymer transporter ExbD [Saprospirales bacterium]